jgi:hypothetical protein
MLLEADSLSSREQQRIKGFVRSGKLVLSPGLGEFSAEAYIPDSDSGPVEVDAEARLAAGREECGVDAVAAADDLGDLGVGVVEVVRAVGFVEELERAG